MITLLHGDHIELSRNELNRLKAAATGKEVRVLDGRTIDQANLTQALESHSLFGGDTVIFIESLFGKLGKKPKLIEALAKILVASAGSADIILWEDKEVGATVLKNLGKVDVHLFKLPTIIFKFLDGIAPHRTKTQLDLFHTVVVDSAPELILSMIVKRVRQLIQLHDGVTPVGLAGWQASRLTQQAKLFSMDKLITMHTELLSMEHSTKTGTTPFTLADLIEQFIISV